MEGKEVAGIIENDLPCRKVTHKATTSLDVQTIDARHPKRILWTGKIHLTGQRMYNTSPRAVNGKASAKLEHRVVGRVVNYSRKVQPCFAYATRRLREALLIKATLSLGFHHM